MSQKITISTSIHAPIQAVWSAWTMPQDIMQWCHASDDWTVAHAEQDVRVGGRFVTGMAAKDGSAAFDFEGVYSVIVPLERIEYAMPDGRCVSTVFEQCGAEVLVTETFDMENEHSAEQQREGWQAILNNFKAYVEAQK